MESSSTVDQKEAELKEMQDQIENYNQMVKQLTTQREMAVKRLSDMDNQIKELNRVLETEKLQVEAKDKELKTKRSQLQTLKNEESELKEKFDQYKKESQETDENLSNARLNEKLIQTKLIELEEFLQSTNAAINDIEKAIQIKDTIKLSALCNQIVLPPQPLSINNLLTNGIKQQQLHQEPNFSADSNNKDSVATFGLDFDPFANDSDPFAGDDPFKSEAAGATTLPEDDPFNPISASANDPFAPSPRAL